MRDYFRTTRSLLYSVLFAAPLFVLYELGAAFLAGTERTALRNGADVLLRSLLAAGGVQGTAAFTAVLLAIAVVLVLVERRRTKIRLRAAPFAGMMLESILYALLFGTVVGTATQWVLGGTRLAVDAAGSRLGGADVVVLSLGAGIYEELVFRVLLLGGLWGLFRSAGFRSRSSALVAAALAALVFSAFHYVGPYGDAWSLSSFLFRFLAGLAFSVLFLLRGFGITAWTHALYDVFLFLARGI
jgi:membrane protease YdiL (CAAX protease family)